MKKNLLAFACILLAFVSHAFEKAPQALRFGTYQNAELSFTRYEPDTLAEAVFLFDVGKSFFEFDTDDGKTYLHFIRRFKIKVLNKAGFDWANVEIGLRKSGDRVDELRKVDAITYTMENDLVRTTRLNQKAVYEEERNAGWKIAKFAMPDVQVGSVIEVQYEVVSPFVFFFKNWEFQKSIPVIYSEYTAAMVPFYNYSFLLHGRNKFDLQTSTEGMTEQTVAGVKFRDMLYTFVIENLAAFRSEPFITCPDDYMIKLNFQLCEFISPDGAKTNYLSTWPKFCNTMLSEEFFGKKISAAVGPSKGLLKEMTLPDSLSTRTKFVYDWVVSNFNWDGIFDKYSDVKVADLLKSKKGSTADINLFLVGMLKAAGVEAYPVLLSTRDHGKFKVDAPFDFFFNYVVAAARIDGNYLLLDATEPTIGFGNLPSRCINERGFLIRNKKEFDWVNLNDGWTSMKKYTLGLTPVIGADSCDCSIRIVADGHYAMDVRETMHARRNELEKSLLNSELSLVDEMSLMNEKDPLLPFEAKFKAKIQQHSEGEVLLLKPFLGFQNTGNPLKKATRQYPIDLIYKQGKRFDVSIRIPDGYELSRMPTMPTVDDSNFKLSYSYAMTETNTLIIKASYEFKKEVYDASVYDKLKTYFRFIDQVFNQTLAFVPKKAV